MNAHIAQDFPDEPRIVGWTLGHFMVNREAPQDFVLDMLRAGGPAIINRVCSGVCFDIRYCVCGLHTHAATL